MKITCICGRKTQHKRGCPTYAAFKFRCPSCKTRKVDGFIRHASDCWLKEFKWP